MTDTTTQEAEALLALDPYNNAPKRWKVLTREEWGEELVRHAPAVIQTQLEQARNYRAEIIAKDFGIRSYRARIESLEAENKGLREQCKWMSEEMLRAGLIKTQAEIAARIEQRIPLKQARDRLAAAVAAVERKAR